MAGLRSFSGTLPTSPELNILGLYFVDPKIEEEFLAEHFNSLFRVHVTMFAIITCLLALISSVPAWSEALGITYDSPQVLAVMPATLIRTLAHLFMPIETAHHTLHRLFIFMAAWPIALRLLPYVRALYLFEEFPPSPNGEGAPRILSQTSFQMEKMLDGEATAPPARVTPSPPRGARRRKSFTPEK